MSPEDALDQVVALLRGRRLRQNTERVLQDGIEEALRGAGIPHRREVRLSPEDRPDFMIEPGVCVEVKIGGASADVHRQIVRYAEHEEVEELLLVTTRRQHVMPSEVGGKRLVTLCVGSAFL